MNTVFLFAYMATLSDGFFIPGKGCGAETEITVLDELPRDFSGMTCAHVISKESLRRYQESLASQMLFVVGGDADQSVEIIDLSGRNQSYPEGLANFPDPDGAIAGAFINNSFVMVCSSSQRCYNYKPCVNQWTETFAMLETRIFSAAIQLSATEWWITGGQSNDTYFTTNTTEKFVAGVGFSEYVDLPAEIFNHNLVRVNCSHIMLLGNGNGNDNAKLVWIFNLESEKWSPLPALPYAFGANAAGLVTHADGMQEVAITGADYFTEMFSLANQTWRRGPTLPNMVWHGCSVQYGDTFLVVGGGALEKAYNPDDHDYGGMSNDASNRMYQYNVEADSWIAVPPMAKARDSFAAFLVPDDFMQCN